MTAETPEQAAYEARQVSPLLSDNRDVMEGLMAAMGNPERFLPRAPMESYSSWQRRAIIEHIAPLIIARVAAQEPKPAPAYDPNHEPGLSECGCRMCDPGRHGIAPEMATATAERDRLAELVCRYERITTAWTRGMYSARIDCTRGDVKAAIGCLSEGLDGYDGTEWNGTETGAEWWERTKAEEGL